MTEMNKRVIKAIVEDWTGNELISFEGKNSAWKAIEWYENEGSKGKTEEEENGILEDLLVVGFDKKGNRIGVDFG